jgi:hypothetical protein
MLLSSHLANDPIFTDIQATISTSPFASDRAVNHFQFFLVDGVAGTPHRSDVIRRDQEDKA